MIDFRKVTAQTKLSFFVDIQKSNVSFLITATNSLPSHRLRTYFAPFESRLFLFFINNRGRKMPVLKLARE